MQHLHSVQRKDIFWSRWQQQAHRRYQHSLNSTRSNITNYLLWIQADCSRNKAQLLWQKRSARTLTTTQKQLRALTVRKALESPPVPGRFQTSWRSQVSEVLAPLSAISNFSNLCKMLTTFNLILWEPITKACKTRSWKSARLNQRQQISKLKDVQRSGRDTHMPELFTALL